MKPFNSSFSPQFILMIGDEGSFFIPNKVPGVQAPIFAAADDKAARNAIVDVLARNPRVSLTLFADTLAQDFRRETVPRLNPLDRPKLIERRLKQAFPQAGIAASLNLKSDRTQVLLVGLHGDNPVFEWLEFLKSPQLNRMPPIALLPVECADMTVRLLPETAKGWAMLLSRQRTGGFRQIVTHKGELIFTRLTPPLPPGTTPQEIAEAVARDIKASLGYLGRLGLTDPTQLEALLLMPEATHPALQALSLPVRARFLSPHQAAQMLRLPIQPGADDPCADLLYAGWLAQKRKIRLPLMPLDAKQTRQVNLIRNWGWRMAAAALLLAFITTAWQASDLFTTLFQAQQESVKLAALKDRLSEEQAAAAPMTEPLGRLRQAIERRRLFSENVTTPWKTLEALSRGIGDGARLVKLEWQSPKPSEEVLQVDVRLLENHPLLPSDKRLVAAQFESLAQNVTREMPEYDVQLARYPFPALPQEALSNEGAKSDAGSDETAELIVRRGMQ